MIEELKKSQKQEVAWVKVLLHLHIHIAGIYGFWVLLFYAKWMTIFFLIALVSISYLGLTVGAHRLYAHRTYTASSIVRGFLVFAHTIAGVGKISNWVLQHRIHHQYYGTEHDPHNHKKGLWYSHVLSNILTHPKMEEVKHSIDMRDTYDDGYIHIQNMLYLPLFIYFGVILPINAPLEYWDESLYTSFFVIGCLRLTITTQMAWLINSGYLLWNLKDGEHIPVKSRLVFLINKSYWPAYHYMVPWDWKTNEFGGYYAGCGRFFIKMMFELGWVDQMVTAVDEDVREILYKISIKEYTMKTGMEELQKMSRTRAINDVYRRG